MSPLAHEEITEKVIGIFYDVYNELGHGFLEAVYRESMVVALRQARLNVEKEVLLPVYFRGVTVGEYRADLVVENKVVVELKTARAIDSTHEAQTLHYLKSTDMEIALLFNFGIKAQFRRLIFSNENKKARTAIQGL